MVVHVDGASPYLSEEGCIVHTSTRVALNAVGIAGYEETTSTMIAREYVDRGDASPDDAYWAPARAAIVDYMKRDELRYSDGGALVLELYGHPDRQEAIRRIREAYKGGDKTRPRGADRAMPRNGRGRLRGA